MDEGGAPRPRRARLTADARENVTSLLHGRRAGVTSTRHDEGMKKLALFLVFAVAAVLVHVSADPGNATGAGAAVTEVGAVHYAVR